MIDPRTEVRLSREKFIFIRDQGCCRRSTDNRTDLEWAAAKAYSDMMPRTIKGLGTASRETKGDIRALSVALANSIAERVKGDPPEGPQRQEEFNQLHAGHCELFLGKLNGVLAKHNKIASGNSQMQIIREQAYGKAQKMVNMLFKYLSCFSDAAEHAGWFDLCHMPIDTYVLEWCRKSGIETPKKPWSAMGVDDYTELQKRIRARLARGGLKVDGIPLPARPLDAEFIIWGARRSGSKSPEKL